MQGSRLAAFSIMRLKGVCLTMTKCSMVSLPNGKKVRAILENKSLLFRGAEIAQAFGYNDPDLVIRRECSDFELKRIEVDGVPTDSLFVSENDVYRLARANKSIAGIELLDWMENYVCPTIQAM